MKPIENQELKQWVLTGMELFVNQAENQQIGNWIRQCPRPIRMVEFTDNSDQIENWSSIDPHNVHVITINKYSFTLEL